MIIDLPDTSTRDISKKLVQIREEAGLSTIGRVLTLIVLTDHVRGSEAAIDAANEASREHPCRVIVVIRGSRAAASRLDAQIRVGGDAGAAEVVVLRTSGGMASQSASLVTPLLLPDTPVAVWWPRNSPTLLAVDKVGRLARRRIVDSDAEGHPTDALAKRAAGYSPGDTDLAWARITHWRSLLAATLDRAPFEPITGATVCGAERAASVDLAGGWLASRLGIDVHRAVGPSMVVLERASGSIVLEQVGPTTAELRVTGQPPTRVALVARSVADCLAEELRRMDADGVYADALACHDRVIYTSASVR
ncbi:glucose-6-phosphate dehydrogenase assembly protein OpcA [Dietzia sp. 179-F 9C3 NHS]|uniref:glucose-6-phosphate dehydrogenase assembly protein OpcA n=1 Tax=Dietzia sp. 179-F 9C3 NHS TaxID=3374295 RepID=UPI003879C847